MRGTCSRFLGLVAILVLAVITAAPLLAQVGKGLLDLNVATQTELLSLPNMTPALVKGILDKRPFSSITEFNAYLLAQKLTPEQTTESERPRLDGESSVG